MVIIPQTDVILIKSPLELNSNHQMSFRNKQEQYNYFNSLPKLVLGDDFTYQRKEGYIRVEGVVDNYYSYNYVMYRNDAYSDKWFYAYINKVEYVNDNCTFIYITLDTFQTWQFDLSYKQCFVEREHVNDDTIGKHTIPEGLETGEYQIVDLRDIPMYDDDSTDFVPCFCVSALPEGCIRTENGRVKYDAGYIGGVFSSLKFFATYTMTAGHHIIGAYEQGSVLTDAIINIYMVPRCCVDETHLADGTEWNQYPLLPIKNYYASDDKQLQEPEVLAGGYIPRNKKLYTSPYSYIYMSNNAGEDIEMKWEDFPIEQIGQYSMPTINYYKYYVPSASLSAKLIFSNYKGYASDNTTPTQMVNYGITFAKLPICAWTTDYYTNWLTQNGLNVQANIGSSIVGGIASIGAGLISGGVIGGLVGGIGAVASVSSSIQSSMARMHQAQTIPPQSHGDTNTGDLTYALKRNSISCYFMSIRPEMSAIIDSYFDKFGYKVNAVKVPNINGRYNWNYVKTIDCYIEASIPQDDLNEIKNMFNNGITIWHRPDTFMDYSKPNPIV